MAFIAVNNLEFILEVAIFLQLAIILVLNLFRITLSRILFFSLILGIGLTALFSFDAMALFLPFLGLHEFTHTYGPIAILVIVTAWAALSTMSEVGIQVMNVKRLVFLMIILITIVGGLVHRDFLILWMMGLFFGFFFISRSFRQKSFLTAKRVIALVAAVVVGFTSLELLSRLLSMTILSPIVRIERIFDNAIPSLKMVISNTTLWGHNPGSSYWNTTDTGSSSGYIALPISLILTFGLPYQIFFGVLVTKKDIIDYFVPGIFGFAFDFGYIVLALLLIWCIFILVLGMKILSEYRAKREKGNKTLLGREALLIGSLAAFASQAILGLFIINRAINGTALVTFIFLSGLVLAHVILPKNTSH
ncbi:hypothetical protein Metbo_1433 [Methanobacterium lacus]|uniref:O-antigen polymerase n=1 Tax=Methanobacterium lacus (strain AL-21) TaxID=877455 RepID=F0T845_METLA|nr:hypothetical protein [Methanobacterium lacus]ADZ09671.1 hypothetical protein Metbo_1433 [Methanobacterium lacus]